MEKKDKKQQVEGGHLSSNLKKEERKESSSF
jgi:hypothetical protein